MTATDNSATRQAARLRIALYILFVLGPAAWALPSRVVSVPALVEVGQTLAIIGYSIYTMQIVLAARIKWIERPFGLDVIFGFHEKMAPIAGALVLIHPFLLAAGYPSWCLLYGPENWYINVGRVALLAGLGQLIISMRFLTKMAFHKFLWTHNVLGVLLFIAGFVHGTRAGKNVFVGPMRIVWCSIRVNRVF